MMKRRVGQVACVILIALLLPAMRAAGAEPRELRVMSFNIRYATPKDIPGGNAWPMRKELLFKTIESFDPDLAGLQEVLPTQGAELKERFARTHEFLGVPRNDGKTAGEMAAILFRRERFEKVRDGTFWLSETPDVVGSKGWDANLPRVVTWVELRDRQNDNRPVLFLNTHFDHLGKTARMESAKLMRRRMFEIAGGSGDKAIIVTGDFNVPQYSPPYKELLTGGGGGGSNGDTLRLVETFKEATPKPTTQDYTFHGFTGTNTRADRIDWVLRSEHFKTIKAAIDRSNDDGRYPSDHYPVEAVLEWQDAAK
jgi:endonuclease/exonuclease/phosphatase family metal-dependent hydrolase